MAPTVRQATLEAFQKEYAALKRRLARAKRELRAFVALPLDDQLVLAERHRGSRAEHLEDTEQRQETNHAAAQKALASLSRLERIARRFSEEDSLPYALNPANSDSWWEVARDALQEHLVSSFSRVRWVESGEEESSQTLRKKSVAEIIAMKRKELESEIEYEEKDFAKFEQAKKLLEYIDMIEEEFKTQQENEHNCA